MAFIVGAQLEGRCVLGDGQPSAFGRTSGGFDGCKLTSSEKVYFGTDLVDWVLFPSDSFILILCC